MELLADLLAEGLDLSRILVGVGWVEGVGVPVLLVGGDELAALLPRLLELVRRFLLPAAHVHQDPNLLHRGHVATRDLLVGGLVVGVEFRVHNVCSSSDITVPVSPALRPLLDGDLLEVRRRALEGLAQLEPIGVELAQGRRASVDSPQELENGQGCANVPCDAHPEALVVLYELLARRT